MTESITLVDSHCHLDDEKVAEGDTAKAILQRAGDAGVKYAQTICTKKAYFPAIHTLALENENLFCSFGIHPHYAGEEGTTYEDIIEAGKKDKVIGIGESGLDYHYNNQPKDVQQDSFVMHLDAARELDLPLIIHTRDAEEDTIEILQEALRKGSKRLLLHCFTSKPHLAEFAIENNITVSASGVITFKKSQNLRDTFATIPTKLLLVETDAPYLAPEPYRGKTNEPAFTRHVAEQLAELKETSLEDIAQTTTENFFTLFSKAKL